MAVSRKNKSLQINISNNRNKLKQRDQFKHSLRLISSDGRNITKMASRIAQAKKRMKSILTNNHMSIHIEEKPWSAILNSFCCNNARPGQFQNSYKRNWRQQKCGSFGECYESHGLEKDQTKQCYEKPTKKDHS